MSDFPSHSLPKFSSEAQSDALFHYTTASGLIGIFSEKAIWSTAYFCANDEQELAAGKGVLTEIFREEIYRLEKAGDSRIKLFHQRGCDPLEYADKFEGTIIGITLASLSAYLTCFCKPASEEDFQHGLLSQWRGYGPDGGYALQFSRKKLNDAIGASAGNAGRSYELKDTNYGPKNLLRDGVMAHKEAYLRAFGQHLDMLASLDLLLGKGFRNPVPELLEGPIEALLDYLIQTKSAHFAEERECRLSLIQLSAHSASTLPVAFFNRNGLPVPFIRTTAPNGDILSCIEWILIGPGPRINARFRAANQLVRNSGHDIKVRVSHIPYTRL